MLRGFLAGVLVTLASVSSGAQTPAEDAAERVPFEKTVLAYRSGPIAENVQIRVKDDHGRERRADILVKVDAFGDGHGPFRARIELGDLAVSIEGKRMLATHRLEKNRYAEFTLADGPLLQSLAAVMPALVLPQLVLADRSTDRIDDLGIQFEPMAVRWEPGVVDRPTGKLLFVGSSGDTTYKMLVDRTTGRLASLQVASGSGAIRNLDLTTRASSPGSPDTWPVEVAGRRRVDGLADLISEAEQVRVGERFPTTMSLLTPGLRQWKENRDDLASVLIFLQPDVANLDHTEGEERDAAVAKLQRETRLANQMVRKLEAESDGKWVARCVVILPTSALHPDITSILLSVLNPTDSAVLSRPSNVPIIAVAQSFDYDSILGGGQGGAVVLDSKRIVRAIITLGEVESTEKKIRDVLGTLK